jgi:spore coat protein CotF
MTEKDKLSGATPATINMTEKDMLSDMLVLEKSIVKTYGSYLVETSCEKLRNVLNKNMKDSAGDQFQVFNSMTTRNYYPVKEAPAQEIQQAKTKFAGIAKAIA